jgi:hypothetical protein
MPYAWSINNVASGEVFHTALAFWQTGRNDEAFRITKSALLDYLYLGKSPGNFGQLSFYDAFRGELYRDFSDGIGAASRALIEGLFGIHPDATNGKVVIRPGFPSDWKFASLKTPDISIGFKRENNTDRYTVDPLYFRNLNLLLKIKAQRDQVKSLTVNGLPAKWKLVAEAIGQPEIEITCEAAEKQEIKIEWGGEMPETPKTALYYAEGEVFRVTTKVAAITALSDPQQILNHPETKQHSLQAVIAGDRGNRIAFIKLHQGEIAWWMPVSFEVRPTVEIISVKIQPADKLQFSIRNNTAKGVEAKVTVNKFGQKIAVGAHAASPMITVPANYLIFGSNSVKVVSDRVISAGNLINWNLTNSPNETYETVDLNSQFNDRVTQIFKNHYLSPRSPYPTLAIPTQGIGDWCSFKETEEIDDSGLRSKAGSLNKITLPQGVPFSTPGTPDVPNILFTSQWDNYPKAASVTLSGKASHLYLLMAGSTHHMQSRFDNGVVSVEYTDGSTEKLVLRNPETWWPIEQDYFDDGFAFDPGVPQPVRVYLKTGEVNTKGYQVLNKNKGNKITGGAATVLDMPLNPGKELKQLGLATLANDVVIGLMAITLVR